MTKLLSCLIVVAASCLQSQGRDSAPSKPLVLVHTTVIDATGAPAQQDMTVVVKDGRIAEIGPSSRIANPAEAEVVDATGKFLIPGLWDMHVHLAGKEFLTLFVANGVTGIRDMHAFSPPMVFQWRKEIQEGKLLGPRLVAAGALVDGAKPIWPGSVVATNEREGIEAVRCASGQRRY